MYQCYFQLSPGGIPPPPESQIPPRKTPKIQKKHIKKCIDFTPKYVFSPPRTWSLELTLHMYPENLEETQVIVGSMNMGYISDTARNRSHTRRVRSREGADDGKRADWELRHLSDKTVLQS